MVEGHLFVKGLDHSFELLHSEDVGLPAMEPDKVLPLEMGPASLHWVER